MSILYTIVPPEIIFGEDEDGEERSGRETAVEVGGVTLLVEPDGFGRGTVKRVISTDPDDYLDQRWQPGMTVRW